jgi:hypothetical protein
MKKLFTAVVLMFMVLAYGAMTGADLLCVTAHAATAKPKPDTTGPDSTDDGTGSGGTDSGPDSTDDGGGCGGGGSGGGSDPDGSGGGGDF